MTWSDLVVLKMSLAALFSTFRNLERKTKKEKDEAARLTSYILSSAARLEMCDPIRMKSK